MVNWDQTTAGVFLSSGKLDSLCEFYYVSVVIESSWCKVANGRLLGVGEIRLSYCCIVLVVLFA